jgi:hypothetical protein
MPDIAMCEGTGCPLRDTCLRYAATPSYRQAYLSDVPYFGGDCEYYWPTIQPAALKEPNDAQ